jgi:putative hydroxymethylpyrimidine transport system substrate-binding protein
MGAKGETLTPELTSPRRIDAGEGRRWPAPAAARAARHGGPSGTAARRGARIGTLLAGAAALTMAVAACGSSGSSPSAGGTTAGGTTAGAPTTSGQSAKPLTATTVLLDWFPNPDHIALYTAAKDGDFAAQGLNVTFQSPSNNTDALKLVSLNKVPLAISYEPDVITSATDPSMNVTAVAALIPVPLDSLIISGKAGVSGPGGLSGKTVGTDGDPTSAAIYKLILARHGLSAAKTNLVTVSEGLIPAMISGKVAAIIGGYRNVEAVQLRAEGLNPQVYPVNQEGVPNYDELVVIANKSRLASDPAYRATVKSFLAGLAKGSAAAQSSPAAALAALSPVAKGYNPTLLKQMVDVTAPLLANSAGFGTMSLADWQSFATWMLHAGLITKSVNVAATGIVSTSLLP